MFVLAKLSNPPGVRSCCTFFWILALPESKPHLVSQCSFCVVWVLIVSLCSADFMAALSDPRAFLSAQEKRSAQMQAMGIEETDINTKDLVLGGGAKKGSKSGPKGGGAPGAKPEEKKEGE